MSLTAETRERILARDGRCSGRFLGGRCSPVSDVHHIRPRSEGGGDEDSNLLCLCHFHHPALEALRRAILRRQERQWRRCRHQHRSREARELCERRLNADLIRAA